MNKNIVIVILIILAILLLAVKYSPASKFFSNPALAPSSTPATQSSLSDSAAPSATATPDSTLQTSSPSISGQNITIISPKSNQNVGRSFQVKGQARVFENMLRVRVTKTQTNEVLYNQPITANAPDIGEFGDYQANINLTNGTLVSGDNLRLEAFEISAKDGSEINRVIIPLIFQP